MKARIIKFIANAILFIAEIFICMILIIPVLIGGFCEWAHKRSVPKKS